MADDSPFSSEQLATPEQWAAMTFQPVLIDPTRFGPEWEQARGSVARAAIALLRMDDQALTRHFMAQPEPLLEAMDVHTALQDELDYLKTHLEAIETAATRMLCVASRCVARPQS
ncbi:hypothetical protein [Steroidobacter cummioxidans]|uniref:hypothetical protein n=1 Tax=Steroidobacter cummioxidans TaxID=1803913 RepID=UPI000E31F067|nr:hypothetical protein [Steroidobacter cummioxidans]